MIAKLAMGSRNVCFFNPGVMVKPVDVEGIDHFVHLRTQSEIEAKAKVNWIVNNETIMGVAMENMKTFLPPLDMRTKWAFLVWCDTPFSFEEIVTLIPNGYRVIVGLPSTHTVGEEFGVFSRHIAEKEGVYYLPMDVNNPVAFQKEVQKLTSVIDLALCHWPYPSDLLAFFAADSKIFVNDLETIQSYFFRPFETIMYRQMLVCVSITKYFGHRDVSNLFA
jgi:hypothetical protein